MTQKAYSISVAFLLAVAAYFIQKMGLLNSDVGSLLYDTKLFLAGGTYVKDFFETNPPLIFYLYSPVIFLVKLTSMDIHTVFLLYAIFLALISLACSACLLNKIFIEKSERIISYVLFYTLLLVLLFLPGCEFGQREHFLMLFAFPYFFSAVLAAQGKKINFYFASFIGVMAGLGFGLKPYFLIPLILIESYLIYRKCRLFGWIRVETIVCLSILIVYLSSVFIFQPNYIYIMLPLIAHLYFVSTQESWIQIFSRLSVIFCCISLGYYFLFYNKKQHTDFSIILILALIGMMLAFIIPRAAWYYHVIPAFGLACLLMSLYLSQWMLSSIKHDQCSKKDNFFLVMVILILFFPAIFYSYVNTKKVIVIKNDRDSISLVSYINGLQSPHSVYCFSANTTADCFPLVYVSHRQFAGRFPLFWWLRGLLKLENSAGHPLSSTIVKDKKYLIESIADDLNNYQADIIIINTWDQKLDLGQQVKLIAYFSKNRKFYQTWQHYHYLTMIGTYQLYQRNSK
jgi:hypothetical protein